MHPSKVVPSVVVIVMAGMTVLTLTSSQVQAAPGNTIFGKAIRPPQLAPALPRTLFIPSISDPELEYRILHDDATQLNDRLSVLGHKKTQVVPVKPDRSTLIALQSIIREQLATTSPNKKQFIQLPLRAEMPHASGPDKMYALLLQPHSMFKRFGLNNVAGQNKKQTFAILGVFRLSESLAPDPQLHTHLGLYGFAEVFKLEKLHKELENLKDPSNMLHNLRSVLSERTPSMEQFVQAEHGVLATVKLHTSPV
ncbi:uncharacterized protein UTRI_06236 [Ustilago trichophora]|uniref:Uncharacterized protein n=1 Tax=Ustilago trichophora TaxID=86804 RepID=A0A5C3EHR9_9BASI|nr:uncharacterized protein UTRI_06236 [Ustilago trichophora]